MAGIWHLSRGYTILKKLLSLLTGKRFVADTLRLTIGTIVAQVITIATLPVLTRLYTPEQFGVFALFTVLVTTVSTFVCLSYEPAIMLPNENIQSAQLLLAISLIVFVMSGLSWIVIYFFNQKITYFLKAPELLSLLWWIPVTLFALGLYQILTYWYSRYREFTKISVARVCQTGVTSLAQIGTGFITGGGPIGLTFGFIFGNLAAAFLLALGAAKKSFSLLRGTKNNLKESKDLLYQYRNFPLYASWGDIMNAASFHIVPVLLSNAFGTAVVGIYFLGYRVVSVPMSLIGSSIRQVLLQRASEQLAQGNSIASLAETMIGKSILLWGPPWLFLAFFAPQVFSIIFGAEWISAGSYVQVLAPLFFFQLVISPASVLLIALQKQHIASIIQALLLIGAVASIGIGAYFSKSPLVCIAIYSAVQCTLYLIYFLVILKYAAASPFAVLQKAISYKELIQTT